MTEPVFQSVAIVGAGAIGGWLGVRLARAGCEVSVLARGDTLAAVQRHGLQLHQGGELLKAQLHGVRRGGAVQRTSAGVGSCSGRMACRRRITCCTRSVCMARLSAADSSCLARASCSL